MSREETEAQLKPVGEAAVQRLREEHGMARPTDEQVITHLVQVLKDWFEWSDFPTCTCEMCVKFREAIWMVEGRSGE